MVHKKETENGYYKEFGFVRCIKVDQSIMSKQSGVRCIKDFLLKRRVT